MGEEEISTIDSQTALPAFSLPVAIPPVYLYSAVAGSTLRHQGQAAGGARPARRQTLAVFDTQEKQRFSFNEKLSALRRHQLSIGQSQFDTE